MEPDLDRIERHANEAEASCWDRRLIQNLRALSREVRFWRRTVSRELGIVICCPGCEYQVETDPAHFFRLSNLPRPHCLNCGCVLSVRVQAKATDPGLVGSSTP